jgi:hypothetical protein
MYHPFLRFILIMTSFLMGKTAAVVNDEKSAKEIVDEMIEEAVTVMKQNTQLISKL